MCLQHASGDKMYQAQCAIRTAIDECARPGNEASLVQHAGGAGDVRVSNIWETPYICPFLFVREHLIWGQANALNKYTIKVLKICLCRCTAKLLVVRIKFDLDLYFSFSIVRSVWMTHIGTQSPCDSLNYVGH